MTGESRRQLEALLIRHEGLRLAAYRDSLGYLTIGVGRLIDPAKGGGISRNEALLLLEHDIDEKAAQVFQALPWVAALDDVRQIVLIELAFQLGIAGLLEFKETLRAIQEGRYADAARHLLASKLAKQTPARANEQADALATGILR